MLIYCTENFIRIGTLKFKRKINLYKKKDLSLTLELNKKRQQNNFQTSFYSYFISSIKRVPVIISYFSTQYSLLQPVGNKHSLKRKIKATEQQETCEKKIET